MKGKFLSVTLVVLALSLVVAACAPPTPEKVEVTKIVEVTKEVPVEITKEVVKEVVKEVMVTPTPAPAPKGKPIRVDVVLPLTGVYTYAFDLACKGCLMGAEETNTAGGIFGRPVYTICRDDGADPKLGVTLAHALCDDPEVVGVYGTSLSLTEVPMAPVFDECGMPNVPHAFSTLVTEPGYKAIFQPTVNSPGVGRAHADALYKLRDVKSVAVLHEEDPCNEQYKDGFVERCEELGIKITSVNPVTKDTVDFKPILTKIGAENPEAIFTACFVPTALIVKQMRELGLKQAYAGTEIPENFYEFTKTCGEAAVGAITGGEIPPIEKHPELQEFSKRFEARWGVKPEPTVFVHYQNYMMLLDAIKRAGSPDRKAIIKALEETDYDGLVFRVRFNPDHTLENPIMTMYEVTPDLELSADKAWRWEKATGELKPE